MHGTSQFLFGQLGHVLGPTDTKLAQDDCHKLRDELGPDAFDSAFAAGRHLAAAIFVS